MEIYKRSKINYIYDLIKSVIETNINKQTNKTHIH